MTAARTPAGTRQAKRPDLARAAGIALRALAAIGGGYALAALSALALTTTLPLDRADAVLTGMMVSFAVYAGAVVWVFAASSAARAWAGIAATAILLAAIAMLGQWHSTGHPLP
ncbi:DUF3649 domain-containing protein [Roseomonas sp. WA12]